jgi:hypothetical protein
MGLMWFDASPARLPAFTPDSIRHEAQQQDKLSSFGWQVHDGRTHGRQQLIDGDFNITTTMVGVELGLFCKEVMLSIDQGAVGPGVSEHITPTHLPQHTYVNGPHRFLCAHLRNRPLFSNVTSNPFCHLC